MVLQASFRHEFVHKQHVVRLRAVPDELYEVFVVKLAQVVEFCLQEEDWNIETLQPIDPGKRKKWLSIEALTSHSLWP